jgi:hypothetical protein
LPGTQYVIAQVASGNDWEGKSVTTARIHFHDYWFEHMPFDLEPPPSEDSVPYAEVLKDYMQSIGYEFGILFIATGSQSMRRRLCA